MKKNVKILAPEEIFLGSLSAVWHYSLRSVLLRYWRTDELSSKRTAVFPMIKNDVSCPECNAGFRRIELVSRRSGNDRDHGIRQTTPRATSAAVIRHDHRSWAGIARRSRVGRIGCRLALPHNSELLIQIKRAVGA